MIRMRIEGLDKLKRLSNDLKNLKKDIDKETREVVLELSKIIPERYEDAINRLVYEQYNPAFYERTFHLLGGHGSKIEDVQRVSGSDSYEFRIDETSRDPVTGTTWKEKADNLEDGINKMRFKRGETPFNRPFISETQTELEFQARRSANGYIMVVEALIKKVGGNS